ncbi:MAG: response regulator transcription factor [Lactobacillus sp.]|jgi:DNA-binding response OmpR family regulator|uniref:Response regulator transcription factor n=1 Tax=Lactobacillus porci TaxID=2012477 RepID=A0A6A8M8S3_9LACO|nr:response regulator transcription factor [Lactobacillus porci]MST86098.1 response regulator transcription factor [Lactobacillus porci]
MERIMLVEDDQQIIANISQTLRKWQYEPVVVKDWNRVAEEVAASQSDLVLCDITLPTFDGFYWIQEVRKKSAVPIIVISAADIDANVMHAVSAGADDYIMKPFSGAVLLAKIQAILRRNKPQVGRQLAFAGASFNSLTNELVKDGQAVQLTPTEGAMLQILLRQKGQAVSKREILELLWQGGKYLNENTLNVNVSRLRGKLHQLDLDKQLLTERGVGYRIVD